MRSGNNSRVVIRRGFWTTPSAAGRFARIFYAKIGGTKTTNIIISAVVRSRREVQNVYRATFRRTYSTFELRCAAHKNVFSRGRVGRAFYKNRSSSVGYAEITKIEAREKSPRAVVSLGVGFYFRGERAPYVFRFFFRRLPAPAAPSPPRRPSPSPTPPLPAPLHVRPACQPTDRPTERSPRPGPPHNPPPKHFTRTRTRRPDGKADRRRRRATDISIILGEFFG